MQKVCAIVASLIMFPTAGLVSLMLFGLDELVAQHDPEFHQQLSSFHQTIAVFILVYFSTAILVATIFFQSRMVRIFSWTAAVLYHGGLLVACFIWAGNAVFIYGFFEIFVVLFCCWGLVLAVLDLVESKKVEASS